MLTSNISAQGNRTQSRRNKCSRTRRGSSCISSHIMRIPCCPENSKPSCTISIIIPRITLLLKLQNPKSIFSQQECAKVNECPVYRSSNKRNSFSMNGINRFIYYKVGKCWWILRYLPVVRIVSGGSHSKFMHHCFSDHDHSATPKPSHRHCICFHFSHFRKPGRSSWNKPMVKIVLSFKNRSFLSSKWQIQSFAYWLSRHAS